MIAILILGFVMIIWSVRNWFLEIKPWLEEVQGIPSYTLGDKITYFFKFLGAIPKGMPFVIDIAITLFAVANLGFGGGVTGGITGLFLSNIISLVILMKTFHLSLGGAISYTFHGGAA